ncbi:TorF family putative porin [Pseudoduganella sp. SL102]|uniref:TorF family putative porin n=1 Tax=Pseudoduganella sp. SL102 TaxID=2995154 RepID=UPI00248D0ABF|nr:TorF family putative porin [Pseudoduganella sp. SL102]WBS02260.1 TorF family putative porin [Pseudoduganella sp. SL102]
MKRLFSGISLAVLFATGASAQVTYNVAGVSDYRYRGISQTRLQPALQGGADWTDGGVYVGAWASTIKWTKDAGGDGSVEIDVYAGKRGELANGVTYDIGVLGYGYPSNGLHPDADTLEFYGQLGYGPATLKYSHAATNLFGFADSRHSGYLDASVNHDVGGGWTVNLHAGRQEVRNHDASSYTDWKAGVTKDIGIVTVAVAYVGTNAGKAAYASPVNGKFTGRDAVLLTVSKVF